MAKAPKHDRDYDRDPQHSIRMSDSDWDEMKIAARNLGLSVAAYLRSLHKRCLAGFDPPLKPPKTPKATKANPKKS